VPFTIAVDADGPIKTPKDLEGHTISGHPMDAALVTFDMFAEATGVDASKVEVVKLEDAMGDQVAAMLKGKQADGVFGFVNTIIASVAPKGIDGRKELTFLTYAEYLPDMYGNTLFVTRELYESAPDKLPGLVQALNHGIADAIADPDAAIASVAARNPDAIPEVNRNRLVGTFEIEMAHPEGAEIGIGDMDPERLERLIALVVESKGLPRTPTVEEVFDASFLPPDAEKIRTLAK
jgi:NitT/TauT family transport system substrate-binding protein